MSELFDRRWSLIIKDHSGYEIATIKPDSYGKSLRVQFEINCATDLRYYKGNIKITNLEPSRRDMLTFNAVQSEFGTGPVIQMTAGYKGTEGIIFDGALHRGFPSREPATGDWVMNLECGLPLKTDKKVMIPPVKVVAGNLSGYLMSAVDKLMSQTGRAPIKKASGYADSFRAAVNDYLDKNTINKTLGYYGPVSTVLKEITDEFNLYFIYDARGLRVICGKYTGDETPIVEPRGTTIPEIEFTKNTGLVGSPTYTDTGAKIIVLLRPELRMFQYVKVKSEVLDRNMAIMSLIHRGDSHGNDWFSEIDGTSKNFLDMSA